MDGIKLVYNFTNPDLSTNVLSWTHSYQLSVGLDLAILDGLPGRAATNVLPPPDNVGPGLISHDVTASG